MNQGFRSFAMLHLLAAAAMAIMGLVVSVRPFMLMDVVLSPEELRDPKTHPEASANQRAGRCGRLGPGIAVRLYSEEDFAARPEFSDPEILRTNLASVILPMTAPVSFTHLRAPQNERDLRIPLLLV